MRVFNEDTANPDSTNYGDCYWGVEISDGSITFFHAQNVNVVDGALVAYRTLANGSIQNLLSIAAGHWVTYFSANVFTGQPICIYVSIGSEDGLEVMPPVNF